MEKLAPTSLPKNASKIRTSTKAKDFRLFLQEQLEAKCARNPHYSLRSFAKHLDVSPSALSGILSGKRKLTYNMMQRLGLRLGLSLEDLKGFKALLHGNSKYSKDPAVVDPFVQITADTFSVISELHHYALLELMKTRGFKSDNRWIAQRLSKTISEINISLERLTRLGLIVRDENGHLSDTTHGFSTDIRDGLSSQAQRQYQERSLQHSIEALQSVPVHLRDNTSMTMAINSQDLPEAKKMIEEFRRRFCTKMESNPILNEVYQLTISFTPMTQNPKCQQETENEN